MVKRYAPIRECKIQSVKQLTSESINRLISSHRRHRLIGEFRAASKKVDIQNS
jgi:hypothetical protein